MNPSIPISPPLYRFAVIGGDLRMTHLCKRLTEAGYTVSTLGCGQDCLPDGEPLPHRDEEGRLRVCTSLGGVTEQADVLILPLPATRDGDTVCCPREPACTVPLQAIAELMIHTPRLLLFGGRLPKEFMDAAEKMGIPKSRITDYYDSEVLQLRNAYLTAEAALMTAMELTDTSLQGTSAAVLGYGRIGKRLARLLFSVGSDLTICARREETLAEAAAAGYGTLLLSPGTAMNGLTPLCHGRRILFNTIPSPILPRDLLTGLERDTLLIDLASAPFGVMDGDVQEAAAKNGLRYLRAPSLPGSYAPRTAGEIIGDCILTDLSRRDTALQSNENGGMLP